MANEPTSPHPENILQFFKFEHLPPHLRAVSEPFCVLARALVSEPGPGDDDSPFPLNRCPERTVALRKLLEAKDAAVRAAISE
jgi:hypothetical protein